MPKIVMPPPSTATGFGSMSLLAATFLHVVALNANVFALFLHMDWLVEHTYYYISLASSTIVLVGRCDSVAGGRTNNYKFVGFRNVGACMLEARSATTEGCWQKSLWLA